MGANGPSTNLSNVTPKLGVKSNITTPTTVTVKQQPSKTTYTTVAPDAIKQSSKYSVKYSQPIGPYKPMGPYYGPQKPAQQQQKPAQQPVQQQQQKPAQQPVQQQQQQPAQQQVQQAAFEQASQQKNIDNAGIDIQVNIEGIIQHKQKIDTASGSLDTLWRAIKEQINTISNSWIGPDASAYINKINKMNPKIDATIQALKRISSSYQSAINNIQENQEKIKNEIL